MSAGKKFGKEHGMSMERFLGLSSTGPTQEALFHTKKCLDNKKGFVIGKEKFGGPSPPQFKKFGNVEPNLKTVREGACASNNQFGARRGSTQKVQEPLPAPN